MAELHIVVQLDDRDVQNFARAVEDLTEIFPVQHWGAHVHEDIEPPSGEIIGWEVVTAPEVRDFHDHAEAARYASKTGGVLSPVFADA